MTQDLNTRFRPTTLNEVVGQPGAVSAIKGWDALKAIPHVILLYGPSGTGKTTLARILAKLVGYRPRVDELVEIDTAEDRGIDMARDLKEEMLTPPLPPGKVKIRIIDEVVQLPEVTQQAMLTLLEEPAPWAYFFLCTTRVSKLLDTFRSRCKTLKLVPILPGLIHNYLNGIVHDAVGKLDEEVLSAIIGRSNGNMRQAIADLELVLALRTREEQLRVLDQTADSEIPEDIRGLCQALMKNDWPAIAKLLDIIKDPPETVRHRVLAYMRKAIRGGASRAALITDIFQWDFAQNPISGLDLACWKACKSGPKA